MDNIRLTECPDCHAKTFIAESGSIVRFNAQSILRTRQCTRCPYKETTIEIRSVDFNKLIEIKNAAKLTVNQITALKELLPS